MANVAHSTLTGANLHEPKGVAAATSGYVYAADGAGSGSWSDPNTLVTAVGFSTGDIKTSFKLTADSTWVLMNDGSIGNAASAATTRANADTEDLFLLLWTNVSDTYAPVSGGRGATAAADYAANKRLTLPRALGRALAAAGAGSGLTSRALGSWLGAETHTLVTAELPAHSHASGTLATGAGSAHSHGAGSFAVSTSITNGSQVVGNASFTTIREGTGSSHTNVAVNASSSTLSLASGTVSGTSSSESAHTHSVTSGSTATTGSDTGHANVQPSLFVTFMVKL